MRMNLLNIIIFSRHSFAVAQLRLTNWESESPASFNLHFQMLKPPPRWRPFETFPPRWQPSSACSSPSPPSSSSRSFLLTASDLIRVRIGRMKRNWYQSETLLRRRKPCCLVQPILLTTPWLLFSPLSLLCLPSCRSPPASQDHHQIIPNCPFHQIIRTLMAHSNKSSPIAQPTKSSES